MKFLFTFILCSLITVSASFGQDFKAELRKLDDQVEEAYKSKKLTEVEYGKLKREHDIIRATLEKAEADDNVTPDEKNRIHSKIIRSKKRLAKYKTNREVY